MNNDNVYQPSPYGCTQGAPTPYASPQMNQMQINQVIGNIASMFSDTIKTCAYEMTAMRQAELKTYQEAARQQKEESRVTAGNHLEIGSSGTYIPTRDGKSRLVWNLRIEKIYLVKPDSHFRQCPFYIMRFANHPPIMFEERLLDNPKSLLLELAKITNVPFETYNGVSVSDALQRYIAGNAVFGNYPFYHGWIISGENIQFELDQGKTHSAVRCPFSPEFFLNQGKQISVCLSPTKTFLTCMGMLSPRLRGMISLCLHASLLFTLLPHWGYTVPKGFVFHCQDARSFHLIQKLLCVFGDSAISMNMTKADFHEKLVERKDQPAVIIGQDVKHQNRAAVLDAVQTGKLDEDTELMAIPVILQESCDYTSYGRSFICVKVASDDFAADIDQKLNKDIWSIYATTFAKYTVEYFASVRDLLVHEQHNVINNADRESVLEIEEYQMLGLFNGLAKVTELFFKKHSDSVTLNLFPDESFNILITALEDCSEITDDEGMILMTFIQTFKNMLQQGSFCQNDPKDDSFLQGNQDGPILYRKGSNFYLPQTTFEMVCKQSQLNFLSVCKVLQKYNIFCGANANKTTYLTRLSIANRQKLIYGLNKEKMEGLL